jgi:5-methylcytosine-specific restriction endonuclease McrA
MKKDWPIYWEVLKRDNLRCVYCGLDGRKEFASWCQLLNGLDHLVPGTASGAASYGISRENMENLVASCWSCNRAKGRFNPLSASPIHVANRQDTTEDGWRVELIQRVRRHLETTEWEYYRPDYAQMKNELGI